MCFEKVTEFLNIIYLGFVLRSVKLSLHYTPHRSNNIKIIISLCVLLNILFAVHDTLQSQIRVVRG